MLATRFNGTSIARSLHRSRALSEEELRHAAPSIFATEAHQSRSSRYTYIPTADVLRSLSVHGFEPFFAVEATTRVENKRGFTKHMLRLRHESQIARGGDDVNEVILINSHDGATSYPDPQGMLSLRVRQWPRLRSRHRRPPHQAHGQRAR